MSLLDDVSAAMVADGIGHVTPADGTDWMIYQGYLQAAPDRAICLTETPGKPPEPGLELDYPGLQVRVRGKADDYQAARAKMQAIFLFLHANNEVVTLGGAYVYCYATQSGPIPLGQDENRRPHLAWNFKLMKQRQS